MVASSPASGPYDHASYLSRQSISLGVNTAGASGTSGGRSFISDMRVRKMAVTVRTAGTSATSGNSCNLMYLGTIITGFPLIGTALTTTTGTNTVGTVALSSNAAFTVTTSTDMNTQLVAGGVLFLKNGTDATGVFECTVEGYVNPLSNWTGPNN